MKSLAYPRVVISILQLVFCITTGWLALPGEAYCEVTMHWAIVGNPGNPDDMADGDGLVPGVQNFGMVAVTYRIAKHEVTNSQYAEFLNAVDPIGTNPNGIYNSSMGSDVLGGIELSRLNAPGSRYFVKLNMGEKPVNYVSWFDAARFANWMNNGQGSASTETGAYDMAGSPFARQPGATIFLPSEDERYKAAYHDPVNAGADAGENVDYWFYPTISDNAPVVGSATAIGDTGNPGVNVANYDKGADWNGQNGNVTTVGSAASMSFYGAFDLGGNVMEWNERDGGASAVLRGGSWNFDITLLQSSARGAGGDPAGEASFVGFRVANDPEAAPGDMNGDGSIDVFDIERFVQALVDPARYTTETGMDPVAYGDINGDGVLNSFDISPFVGLLTGGSPGAQPQQLKQFAALKRPHANNDGDGQSNTTELLSGTDPEDSTETFRVTVVANPSDLHLTWPTVSGKRYRVTQSLDLGDWIPINSVEIVEGNGSIATVAIPLSGSDSRFYRVELIASSLAP